MKTNNFIFLFIMLFNAVGFNSFAYVVNIDGISYDVVKKLKEATVISASHRDNIVIPEFIEYEGTQCAVTSIGKEAFYNHSTSFTITIPKSIKSIGRDAFKGCDVYNAVNITDIEAWCKISFESNPIWYARHVYLNGEELKDLVIPSSVTSISNFAFWGLDDLNSVTISNGVTDIGDKAFRGCINLKSITIPTSVTSIGESAFADCRSLTEIEIPNSVTSIGNSAFEGCWELKTFVFPEHIIEIKDNTLKNCFSLESVTIPNGVIRILDNAFYGCGKLISVNIPSSVSSIGNDAFYDCKGLTSVCITDLGAWCETYFASNPLFYAQHLYLNGDEITDLIIPDGTTMIGRHAFAFFDNLTSVVIPNSVTSIGEYAFYDCI